ncbi:DUF7594 domain-containing protein [Hyalangium rubrum]|uniref:DNRLRE domain-containing protein n=1 Tax=Hyalangium rubrum TaxID=3103134 RepID=A0ABU5H3H3_9BACT|nr:DNRLRE domain-containing protein [Hyalangium sp. s54d21]MDY7228003.1 DNRLRE domain-containing protein [Hyalangium sp. s54d21]
MRWAACVAAIGFLVRCGGGLGTTEGYTEQRWGVEEVRTFAPVADARVEAGAPSQNFGGSSVLKVDGSPEYASYLRFELSGLSGTISHAKLRLYATDATANGPAVYTTGSGWQEGSLTFDSKPAPQSLLSNAGAVAANAWVEWDVTAAVQGNGTVSFAVRPTGGDGTVFHSREASTASLRPQLVVTLNTGSGNCTVQRQEHTVLATDSISVAGETPTVPSGTTSVLEVDGSPLRASYLRFTVPDLGKPVVGARLRLFAVNATSDGPKVHATANGWSESTGVTWNTRPANTSGALADTGTVGNETWVQYDVGSAIQGAGVYSFGLMADVTDGVDFVARASTRTEATPRLILITEQQVCSDPPDGGTGTPPDGGTGSPDAGTPPPTSGDWTFYGTAQGAPRYVYGVSADQGGNIWVAGGEEGLFVLQQGQTQFRRFTMADGLRPYGYMIDGSAPTGTKYLKVISVAGGPPGVAFVGYEGKKPASGMPTCEDEWDQAYAAGRPPDASIYKSGDADRVTLTPTGIQVVHYDLSTGPNKVAAEPRGREKICNILRIAYDPVTKSVWFGANHGFSWGKSDFAGYSCAPGTWDYGCAGVMEHVHPAINAWNSDGTRAVLLTDAYYGVSVASNGDVWFGGANRSTRFRYGTNGRNYWQAQVETEGSNYIWNRLDIWPDAVGEPNMPTKAQRVDDHVSGMAVMSDQSVWVGSFTLGLAQLSSSGQRLRTLSTELVDGHGYVSAVAGDPLDNSVWAGASWGGGLSRVRGNTVLHYGSGVLPSHLIWMRISDIQVDRSGTTRRILVGFEGTASTPGSIGVYHGQ